MAARVVKQLPEGPDWLYELKFDGYRALLLKNGQHIELRSRKNKDLAGMYPAITLAGQRLRVDHGWRGREPLRYPPPCEPTRP